MKKTLLTILQLLVTGALLYWVFHDPAVRSAMATAIRDADYRWIAAAIAMYVIVEVAAVVRWQILLKVQGINLSNGRIAALFFIGIGERRHGAVKHTRLDRVHDKRSGRQSGVCHSDRAPRRSIPQAG